MTSELPLALLAGEPILKTTQLNCPDHGSVTCRHLPFREPFCPQCQAVQLQEHNRQQQLALSERKRLDSLNVLVPSLYRDMGFGDFVLSRQRKFMDQQARLLKRLGQYAIELQVPRKQKNLILYGPTGTGKTMLSYCLMQTLHAHFWPRFRRDVLRSITSADLQTQIKRSWDDRTAVHESVLLETLSTCAVLLIDELGLDDNRAGDMERLGRLIDMRYQQQLPTIITTNLPTPEAVRDHIGHRSFDRLNQNCIWAECIWPSYREATAQVEKI